MWRRILVVAVPGIIVSTLAVVGVLGFVHTYANLTEDKRCVAVVPAQWLEWSGCIIAAHDTLAAGLIGAAGALLAAVIAADAVWRQIMDLRNAEQRRTNSLAASLHAELADLVARCCFDYEKPWQSYWSDPSQRRPKRPELRRFTPAQPIVFANASGDLALLGADAPLHLVQFHNSLSALRRDIDSIADGLTEHPATQEDVKQVAERFFLTLSPGLDALRALATMVPNAEAVERAAIKRYDDSRLGDRQPPPERSLQQRIRRFLQLEKSEADQKA